MSMPEAYPMPMFPMLTVADAARSSSWYQEALGFQHVFSMPGPGGAIGLVHLRFARYADVLMRAGAPSPDRKGCGIALNFAVTENIDALAERARAAGAIFIQEPGDRPWNARDFTVSDPDGFALTFTMGPLKRDISLEDVVANAQKAGAPKT